ncbi:MAG: GGDEF domain-containing protein, partial [Nitrospirota bacterium]
IVLTENYRESDIIARIGGDEFIVIPVGSEDDAVEGMSSRFYNSLEKFNKTSGLKYDLSASIGLAYYDPQSPTSLETLLKKADELMYIKKKEYKK